MPLKLIGAAAAVAAAAIAVWFFAIRDDDDSSSDSTANTQPPATAPPTVTQPLDESGSELEELLARSRDATYHATYEATTPPETEAGTARSYQLEIFRSEGRTRQDTVTVLDGGDYLTAGILDDGLSTICTKQGTADWVCSQNEVTDDTVTDGIFGEIVRSLGGVTVTATDDVIDGRDVRCFSYESPDGPGSMCLTEEGIPVRIVGGTSELLLTELEDTVADDAFEPPAEPVQAEPES